MEQQTLFKVRDLRKKDQYKIDDKYLNGYARIFGVATTAVYNSLSRHAEFHTQEAFPSEELIAKEHGISKKSVQKAIKQLKEANIIQVEKNRQKGKWLNNMYFLIDKSEWQSPEAIRELWRTRGLLELKTRGLQRSIKDNIALLYKDNKDVTTPSVAGKDINLLIEMFKVVNPSYVQLFKRPPQRQALERMLKLHGREKLEWAIKVLDKTNKMPFSPTITTPTQLENKLGDLIAFCQKEKIKSDNKKNTIVII